MNLKNLLEKLDSHSNIKAEKMIEILSAEQLSDEDILYIIENYKKIHNLRFILVIKYLVARVENVKIMVKIIKLIEYSGYKLELVTKLPDNEKMQFLDERKEYFDQDEILNTIEDQGVLIDYLSSSSSDRIREFTKALIISRLKNDGLKLEYLDKIKVENNKALIISTLLDDQVKLKLLQEMKSNKARAIIYSSLREKRNIDEIPIPIKKKYNKIGLPDNMTFGIEIESEGSAYKYFYDMETVINDWISKKDMSLENGIEIVSPPLYDRSESVSDIYTINSLLSQAGMFTNYNCGGHIHIGADYLTSIESYVNLLELYCNCEKIIYLISNKEDDIIDKDRIGVTGGSYGGFMVNWIIGHTDRFKCAASQRSISNWIDDFGTTDIGYYFNPDELGGDVCSGFDKLWEQSPLKYANNAKTPTLFIHSEEDYRCYQSQAFQMFTALKYYGIESRICLFKGENHELSRSGKPKHRVRRLKEITDWFEKYLK